MDEILVTEPVWIRFYSPGGKGGYGYSSSPWHRLVARGPKADRTACGATSTGKYVVKDRKPSSANALCVKCWPGENA